MIRRFSGRFNFDADGILDGEITDEGDEQTGTPVYGEYRKGDQGLTFTRTARLPEGRTLYLDLGYSLKRATKDEDSVTGTYVGEWGMAVLDEARRYAPFPIELPYRLIQLYTFEDEVVLDPFVGSGTTCLAALKTKRRYVGYDNNKKYCELAERRIEEYLQSQNTLYNQQVNTNQKIAPIASV